MLVGFGIPPGILPDTDAEGTNPLRPSAGGTQTGNAPPGTPGFVDHILDYYRPPRDCTISESGIPSSKFSGDAQQEDPQQLFKLLPPAGQAKLNAARSQWRFQFPGAGEPILWAGNVRGIGGADRAVVYLVRSGSGWDPVLLTHPILQGKTTLGNAFEGALRLFFPDYVIQQGGSAPGAFLRNGKAGSMTPDGPFPYWVPMVSENMVAFGVQYLRTPGAFGAPAKEEDRDIWGDALLSGLQAGAASGNIYVAAGAAIGNMIIDFFSSIFSGDPEPPDWLKRLNRMATIRKATGGDFSSKRPGTEGFAKGMHVCHRAFITSRGKYNIMDGYAEVMRRLSGGGGGGKSPWLVALLAGGATLALGM